MFHLTQKLADLVKVRRQISHLECGAVRSGHAPIGSGNPEALRIARGLEANLVSFLQKYGLKV